MPISRRYFLRSLSRTALVLSLNDVLRCALPSRGLDGAVNAATPEAPPDLGLTFLNVAREAGLNAKTIFGGEHKNKYLLETTGCGVAFYDYDNDGWLDIFLVNGTRLEGFP
ncbi:MAG TPA: CRTAC1 family protein, partial [Terriglobales bacterium]|nr:CRTAC1 family protein [Terriglobales bacterium]